MIREELNKLTKEELIEECIDLQVDNAWWQRRWEAEHRTAWEVFKPKIDKATKILRAMKHCELLIGSNKSNIDKLLETLGDKENEKEER